MKGKEESFPFYFVLLQPEYKKDEIMDLPQDPMMLFSVINMKLRDYYRSLDELCEDLNVDKQELIDKLAAYGFEYSEENNKFW